MQLALAGEPGPLWVRAERQTAGRGRSGRGWVSLSGNLHASLLIRPRCAIADAAQLSLVAGVALFDAVRRLSAPGDPAGLRVKWPNDILIADAKLGGILIESTIVAPGSQLVTVVGLGLNLAAAPDVPARPATHLAAHGLSCSPRDMLHALDSALWSWLSCWDDGRGFARVREGWLARAGAQGERVSVNAGGGPVAGRFAGLGVDGALLILDDAGRERRFTFGDVTLLPAGGAATDQNDGK